TPLNSTPRRIWAFGAAAGRAAEAVVDTAAVIQAEAAACSIFLARFLAAETAAAIIRMVAVETIRTAAAEIIRTAVDAMDVEAVVRPVRVGLAAAQETVAMNTNSATNICTIWRASAARDSIMLNNKIWTTLFDLSLKN